MVRLGFQLGRDVGISYQQLVDTARRHHASNKRDLRDLIEYRESRAKRPRTSAQVRPFDTSQWLGYEALQSINDNDDFRPLQPQVSKRIEREALLAFSDAQLDRKVCLVTDVWVFATDAICLPIDELPLLAMRLALSAKSWTTPAIEEYYDCSRFDSRLHGMLLSARAIEQSDDLTRVWISIDALSSLRDLNARLIYNPSQYHNITPPKYAIADCFVAGAYQEIDEATLLERQTIGLAQTRGLVKVIYGGPGNMLQSHLLCWDNRHATIASSVPSVPRQEHFQIVLAGPMTPQQELALAKRHECSGQRVLRMHQLLRAINPLYATVEENAEFDGHADTCQVLSTRLEDSEEAAELVNHARARQDGVAGHPVATCSVDQETVMLESETVLIETAVDRGEQDRLARAYEHLTQRSDTFVARRSTAFLQHDDEFYIERLFPHLFTFGIGGFSAQRAHRYSRRDVILHYLNLSTSRFAEDSLFKLQMFDYLGTVRVKSGVFVYVRHDPSIATKSLEVTPEQLRRAMEARATKRRALKSGRPAVVDHDLTDANCLVKAMDAATAKMWGSNEQRDAFQRKVDAMVVMYGEPSLFWTLTPNPDSSIAVAFWTGHNLPGGRPKDLVACTTVHMPSPADMSKLVMDNTVVQAHYYRKCCRLLIEVMFGWDMVANKPKSEPGMFGFVEALFFALEQQGRLRVHHHGVAWIAGLPKTKADWERVLATAELRTKYEAYCASIFAAELPVFSDLSTVKCPQQDCVGELEPLPIPKKYKYRLKHGTPPPDVAICSACSSAFAEQQVISSVIDSKWVELSDEQRVASTETAVQTLRMRFGGLSDDTKTANVQLSRLLQRDQVHAYEHTLSCVKGQSRSKCRYRFYRGLASATSLTMADEMMYRRSIGNQWLNTYIPLWRRLMHFNMDARMLWSGDSLQAIRYAVQYASKRQSVLDNAAVVELAFRRRLQRERDAALAAAATTSTTPTSASRSTFRSSVSRLMSLAFASSGVMEVGGPLAATILMEGDAAMFSCKFVRLVLFEGLNMMNGEDVEASIITRDDQLFTDTSISKYVSRPASLEDWCWYDFCAWFKPRQEKSSSNQTCQQHRRAKCDGYVKMPYPQVPEIIGPRLPDVRNLPDADFDEQNELYYRAALLLRHPFRDPCLFLDDHRSAKTHFEQWSQDAKTRRALDFHQQHHLSLDKANAFREHKDDSSDDSDYEDNDVLHCDRTVGNGSSSFDRALVSVPSEIYEANYDTYETDTEATEQLQDIEAASNLQYLAEHSIDEHALPDDMTAALTVHHTSITQKNVQQVVDAHAEDLTVGNEAVLPSHAETTTQITVEVLEDATRCLNYERHDEIVEIPPLATISQVSSFFHLNHEQHAAFVCIGIPLLYKIAEQPLPPRFVQCGIDGSPVIVTGPGGTGKSRIVDAVRALAAAWGRPGCVMVTASTGIAAAGLKGTTMHNSVGLGINQSHLSKHLQHPNQDQLQHWDPILCVIADELSMIDLKFFGLWEEALCNLKESPEPFGGLITALMYDLCQLKAVQGLPVYTTTNGRKPLSQPQERGRRVYQGIRNVVYLNQSMRFQSDPQWGQWLAEARLGRWDDALKQFISACPSPLDRQSDHNNFVQVVSSDNATRSGVNKTATQVAAHTLSRARRVFAIPAQLSKAASPADWPRIRNLTDSQTGNIPVYFTAYIGMPVRVKANQCISRGVANGALGELFHIDWSEQTTFQRQADGLWLASQLPINMYVRITNFAPANPFPGLPSAWPTSVTPVCPMRTTFKLDKRNISIKGYPIVPAFGTTVHGVQGETREEIAVSDLRPPHFTKVDKHALYVALSRVRTRDGLRWIGRKPSERDYEYFGPNADVLAEDARLGRLAASTLRRVFSEETAATV